MQDIKTVSTNTFMAKIFIAGPIEVGKQICRRECYQQGLCVSVEPTTYIYTGGEEIGYVVRLINYPRFPSTAEEITQRATNLLLQLLEETYQKSATLVTSVETTFFSGEHK